MQPPCVAPEGRGPAVAERPFPVAGRLIGGQVFCPPFQHKAEVPDRNLRQRLAPHRLGQFDRQQPRLLPPVFEPGLFALGVAVPALGRFRIGLGGRTPFPAFRGPAPPEIGQADIISLGQGGPGLARLPGAADRAPGVFAADFSGLSLVHGRRIGGRCVRIGRARTSWSWGGSRMVHHQGHEGGHEGHEGTGGCGDAGSLSP